MEKFKFKTIDEYHALCPEHVRPLLDELRAIIKKAAPKATEVISYNMPAFKQHGVLVYYAINKKHIGFYPTGTPIVAFQKELESYETSKGAIHFSFNKHIPKALVTKIVKYRILDDLEREKEKKKKR